MRQPSTPRRALRFAVAAAALAPLAFAALGAPACLGPDQLVGWICLNPVTGHEDGKIYDTNNFANGAADPCHCYDKCGPQKSCPIDVDAGPQAPGCPVGDGGDGG